MSKISISAAARTDSAAAAMLVHRVAGISLQAARDRLRAGQDGTLYRADLFPDDHPARDREIVALVDGLLALGVAPFVAMIGHAAEWTSVARLEEHEVRIEVLRAVLDEARGRYR